MRCDGPFWVSSQTLINFPQQYSVLMMVIRLSTSYQNLPSVVIGKSLSQDNYLKAKLLNSFHIEYFKSLQNFSATEVYLICNSVHQNWVNKIEVCSLIRFEYFSNKWEIKSSVTEPLESLTSLQVDVEKIRKKFLYLELSR